jgi:7-dehydrocholesterol reductase
MEIHPRLLGVDVKQWTNCRVGMMSWQILIIAFLIAGSREGSINRGHAANVFIQTIYIAKFFLWETGYFNTLDMILDRAGYYICWGCLVWVPCLYTYSSFYLVEHHSTFTSQGAIIIALIGNLSSFSLTLFTYLYITMLL